MADLFTRFTVRPGYARGFAFDWETNPTTPPAAGTTFTIEHSETGVSDWTAVSPALPRAIRTWMETAPRSAPRDAHTFFRVVASTAGTNTASQPAGPYAAMTRREFLILRELMRLEMLQASGAGGVELMVWKPVLSGAACALCIDPTTGACMNSRCQECRGTGKTGGGYHGPYSTRGLFSTTVRAKQVDPAADRGTQEPYARTLEIVGWPMLNARDVLGDCGTGKRYMVDIVEPKTEIRGVPAAFRIKAHELPITDAAYTL